MSATPWNEVDALLRERLTVLEPLELDLINESHLHAGHAGAKDGAHFRLHIVSARFSGRPTVARHRLVFDAVGDLMRGKIHALAISAKAPEEV
ncbi:MAG TPA: BolA family protein [Rhodocyclaceae bacterium]|nr:BolA family protein [Rhodocyclaceae bacterium]